MNVELKPCGTNAAYHRHRARGERPCAACMKAHSEETRLTTAARGRALVELSRAFPKKFQEFYVDALAQERVRRGGLRP